MYVARWKALRATFPPEHARAVLARIPVFLQIGRVGINEPWARTRRLFRKAPRPQVFEDGASCHAELEGDLARTDPVLGERHHLLING